MGTEYYNGIFSKKHKRLHQLPLVSPAEKDSDDTCEKQSLNKKESIFTPAQGRQVEGVFPCSARTLPDMADPRTMQIGGSFPMPDKRFAGLKRCRDI